MSTYFTECRCIEDVKKQYKDLCKKYHPDLNVEDTTAKMQELNSEYEVLFAKLKDTHRNIKGEYYESEEKTTETAKQYSNLINRLMTLDGLVIEIIGSFIWLSGNTKDYKDLIKQLGFRWSSQKEMWYKSPLGYKKRTKRMYGIDEIRNAFGSETLNSVGSTKIAT